MYILPANSVNYNRAYNHKPAKVSFDGMKIFKQKPTLIEKINKPEGLKKILFGIGSALSLGYLKAPKAITKEEAEVQLEFSKNLAEIEDFVLGGNLFKDFQVSKMAKEVKTKEEAEIKYNLAKHLSGIIDEGLRRFSNSGIIKIINSVKTEPQAETAKNLSTIKNNNGLFSYSSKDIAKIVKYVKTDFQAKFVSDIAKLNDQLGDQRFHRGSLIHLTKNTKTENLAKMRLDAIEKLNDSLNDYWVTDIVRFALMIRNEKDYNYIINKNV